MTQLIYVFICTLLTIQGFSQDSISSPIGHCHNDYRLHSPFTTAFEAGMGSIEADVYCVKGELYVAHSPFQIKGKRTLDRLYLEPIVEMVRQGKAHPLQLLIDVKYRPKATLRKIIEQLEQYPTVFNENSPITIIISGKRPPKEDWDSYPPYIFFDGRPFEIYTEAQQKRIGMISFNFKHYKPDWSKNKIKDVSPLKRMVDLCHAKGERIRFWNAPDNKTVWQRLLELGVDIINTDNPVKLNLFFQKVDAAVTN